MSKTQVMTWEEIDKDWAGLQKRHRMEIAQAVARYCVGHKMSDIAERLDYSVDWVSQQLDFAGVAVAIGHESTPVDSWEAPGSKENGSSNQLRPAVNRVVSEYGPDVKVKYKGRDKSEIVSIEGDDAESFQPYLDHYVEEGHEPVAAVRLAKAEWAAEEAVNAGVIKETTNKRNEKVNQILFPQDAKDSFELDLKHHMARVKAAASFLDEAKVPSLRRASTRELVESANAEWRFQMKRLSQYHPSMKGV